MAVPTAPLYNRWAVRENEFDPTLTDLTSVTQLTLTGRAFGPLPSTSVVVVLVTVLARYHRSRMGWASSPHSYRRDEVEFAVRGYGGDQGPH